MVFISMGKYSALYGLLYRTIPVYRMMRIPARHLLTLAFLIPFAASFFLGKIKSKSIIWIFIILTATELFIFDRKFLILEETPQFGMDRELAVFLSKHKDKGRIMINYDYRSVSATQLRKNSGLATGASNIGGVNPLIVANYFDFILRNKNDDPKYSSVGVQLPWINPYSNTVDYLNVKYIVTDETLAEEADGLPKLKLVFDEGIYKLYENLNAYPRFFIVHNARFFKEKKELANAVVKETDFSQNVFILDKGRDKTQVKSECTQSPGMVNIVSYAAEKIKLKISSECKGFLTSSEVFYPGWHAFVDGKKTKIYLGNMAFRVIEIPKGKHEVEFAYRPLSLYAGAMVSISSLAVLVYLFIRARKSAVED